MKHYIKVDDWNIVEEGFDPHLNKISESIFSLGNGRMGQRANFEETYSGERLQGSYVAGVYYPDKTRVGWWKNGYPEYFAKVLNAANWIGIDIQIEAEVLDLAHCTVTDFHRILNMQEGYLDRQFVATLKSGKQVRVKARRFCSIADDEAGAIRYSITPLNFEGSITILPYVDGNVRNQDANYEEQFWEGITSGVSDHRAYVIQRTRKTAFEVFTGVQYSIVQGGQLLSLQPTPVKKQQFAGSQVVIAVKEQQETTIYKYAVNLSSENYPKEQLQQAGQAALDRITAKGFDQLLADQALAWAKKWEESDIVIKGDVAAQQGIRFNIFQLHQTYTGEDARLNIGPKGFTGEKYGGSTYWDTEAYCIPFYLATADPQVARNLLVYRYKHLPKAIENAAKLGFKNGAALYPMVTMNGEECHNEWEITFEEIHRNAAIAFAIYNYIRYTGEHSYLSAYGLEVLIGIARFWSQRVNWSEERSQYVMLGVTGPNEYENNVNNNWYTSTMATWCLSYTLEALQQVEAEAPADYARILGVTAFDAGQEPQQWQHIVDNMYYPVSAELGIFLQQDGYLDKEQVLARDLDPAQRPLNQKWSWDRILRSCFIKQADVLQGLYFLEERYDMDTIRRNFDFYEPRTVHESSLSPCVHAILAAKLGDGQRAYEFYLRTSRLDLDDYNNDTEDGLHITSMAGTWMSVVEGFAGMRVRDGQLHFTPFVPDQWQSFAFKIRFRGILLEVAISKEDVSISNQSGTPIQLYINEQMVTIAGGERIVTALSLHRIA
ncbi:glycoside hydrolase family 65 protein [Chitinophaga pendula]|uniref:glycoside hydrolase family 65 protein n=1 Tax=Chitinophaga TaxID=79328 RepID=UPI000BAF9D9F|nr:MULTISPECIES: glycoside hydrolase family 65 protein [Chitinophaga]ASZ12721.1 family 65 glycosyl hydrolase [Chitinophaga sp. MD30]UCJ09663.1 glycoside hydrolase family 65 protein [Chitinophaga pendula]